ncbi:ornithine--oxo-acid aminotransferase [Candidatus Nitromaritima sp. SCGC AAA799-C22]|nr:ornithine--oxo-acid aminotransferase [Candidatus Nitromaritima sp. SCGC AAA799-C22]
MDTQDFIRLETEYGAHNYNPLDVVLTRGEGIWVWDVEGDKYLDCLSSYSAVNQGHCHPKILKAMNEQAKKLTLVSRAFRNDQLGPFYKEICELTHSHSVLPMNSGAEAVETSIKAIRKWGYQVKKVPAGLAEIIVCDNNFHGRTLTIVGFSTEEQYRDGYAPFTPGFKSIPFGDTGALEKTITPNTVGFLVEPIQGEGGVIVPPAGYLKSVREICDRHNVMLILDEIQTGLGRTGKLFAEEHEGIESDLTLIGKALSGGFYPVSAVLSNKEVLGVFNPGDHGSTFGGNPLACAVAREALKVLVEENLVDNAATQGEYFMKQLRQIDSPHVKEVRGRGLLIGIELSPESGGARRFCEALREEKILCKETHQHVIRFAPPLTIQRENIDWALERIRKVLV